MKLCIHHLEKSFGDKSVLRDVTGEFEKSTVHGLLGRNGAGKTTLFNIISEQLKRDSGEIWLEHDGERMPLEPKDIFLMVAEPDLPAFLTGYELIKFFIEANADAIASPQPIEDYFNMVAFDPEDYHRLIQDYSTGMKNKLQMLMFLILRPLIILMDEPLTSLDVIVQLEMKRIIRDIRKDHIIIFSTHILQLARDLCDSLTLLNRGQLTRLDEQIMSEPNFESRIIALLSDGSEVVHD